MCIGNMRSGTEALCAYFHTRDKEILRKALTYFGVVLLLSLIHISSSNRWRSWRRITAEKAQKY